MTSESRRIPPRMKGVILSMGGGCGGTIDRKLAQTCIMLLGRGGGGERNCPLPSHHSCATAKSHTPGTVVPLPHFLVCGFLLTTSTHTGWVLMIGVAIEMYEGFELPPTSKSMSQSAGSPLRIYSGNNKQTCAQTHMHIHARAIVFLHA